MLTKIKILFLVSFGTFSLSFNSEDPVLDEAKIAFNSYVESTYDCLGDKELSYKALQYGLKGYYYLSNRTDLKQKRYLTIVDFSLPSNKKRLYIIDMTKEEIVHKSIVSHGMKTGKLFAEDFSNEEESHKSSLGFYITGHVYDGRHDKSLKLHGLEKGYNDLAFDRGVVIHAAKYATEEFLHGNGNVLGRSYGCPALPFENYDEVIDYIKDGSCFFIYHPNKDYLRHSRIINSSKAYTSYIAKTSS